MGLASCGTWTDAATPVLWRKAPGEVRPPDEEKFSVQVDLAVADIPHDTWDRLISNYEAHGVPVMRDHQLDWLFFLNLSWVTGG